MITKPKFNQLNGRPQINRPKKCRQVRSNIKANLIVFFDFFGLVHYEFVSTGQTVNHI